MLLCVRFLCIILVALAGCKEPVIKPPDPPTTGGSSPAKPWEPTEAQPKLATLKMFAGTVELQVEQARTERQIQTGMMFRKKMANTQGMLFIHPDVRERGYWMNNVTVPLSIAYIDPAGRIVEIHDMQPLDTNSVFSVSQNIQYALEVPQGWFKRKGVGPGAMVMTEKGSLPKTYFPKRQ
jgi:uncharacterized membrane protein (UPF0127 family)|tara:strand:+ start:175 stop:714 length:540 start_codon:yes stop_codon:yes gene_type:complete